MLGWLFKRSATQDTEQRSSGFTEQVMAAREAVISGRRGVAELTATVQGCVSLWEGGLSAAEVQGTDMLTASDLALCARSLGLKGEAVFWIRGDRLIPASHWDISTRDGIPRAYKLSIPDVGGGHQETALAPEVLHIRVGADPAAPWRGQAPLKRAPVTAGMLHAVEDALSETFETAPLGSQITPMPENPEVDNEALGRSFRGKRGRVLLRESVQVTAAGGPAPVTDWKPSDLSPDLSRSMTAETLAAARQAVMGVYGVLPALMEPRTTGPVVREAQRHLATWMLQPIAGLIADEASRKLGETVTIDTMQPLQAYDAGGRARALNGVIQGLALARESGLSDEQITAALKFAGISEESD